MKTPPALEECGKNCCPAKYPYLKELYDHNKTTDVWVPTGKMFCYIDPEGFPKRCRMTNSGFAPPIGFEWGQDHRNEPAPECEGAYRHAPLKSCDDLKCCPDNKYVKEWYDGRKKKLSGRMWCYPNAGNNMHHPCRMTGSGFAPPSGYQWGQNQRDCSPPLTPKRANP